MSGLYSDAAEEYRLIRKYKNVDELLKTNSELRRADEVNRTARIRAFRKIGNTVSFGAYPQGDFDSPPEPIDWIVLNSTGAKSLLISKFALDCLPYHRKVKNITWENSNLRIWLDTDFYCKAFLLDEQDAITNTLVAAEPNAEYETDPGDDTYCKIFLLSASEVESCLKEISQRRCEGTPYCYARGADKDEKLRTCRWWLRTPGINACYASLMANDGTLDNYGYSVLSGSCGVRPAIWVDLSKDYFR